MSRSRTVVGMGGGACQVTRCVFSSRLWPGNFCSQIQHAICHDNPEHQDKGSIRRELVPRLVRTFQGHTGYVHSIAVLGAFGDEGDGGDADAGDEEEGSLGISGHSLPGFIGRSARNAVCGNLSERLESSEHSFGADIEGSYHSTRSGKTKHCSGRHHKAKTTLSSLSRRMGNLNTSDRSDGSGNWLRKRALFVSASRDNTVRMWTVGHEERDAEEGHATAEGGSSRRLWAHPSGESSIPGVLCVCAVPSLAPNPTTARASRFDDEPSDCTASAGQFVSGGSDGMLRAWDVRAALNVERVPRSGLHTTVQLQAIGPHLPPGRGGGRTPPPAVAITSLVCTHSHGVLREQHNELALFSGDASGVIRRYGRRK